MSNPNTLSLSTIRHIEDVELTEDWNYGDDVDLSVLADEDYFEGELLEC